MVCLVWGQCQRSYELGSGSVGGVSVAKKVVMEGGKEWEREKEREWVREKEREREWVREKEREGEWEGEEREGEWEGEKERERVSISLTGMLTAKFHSGASQCT